MPISVLVWVRSFIEPDVLPPLFSVGFYSNTETQATPSVNEHTI